MLLHNRLLNLILQLLSFTTQFLACFIKLFSKNLALHKIAVIVPWKERKEFEMLLQDWMISTASLSPAIVCFVKNSIKLQLICEKCFETFHSALTIKRLTRWVLRVVWLILLGHVMWWRWTFSENKDDYERLNFSPAVDAKWCQSVNQLENTFFSRIARHFDVS